MTTFQIILIAIGSIIIGIPLYLFVGKAGHGHKLGLATIGLFMALIYWDSGQFKKQRGDKDLKDKPIAKALWLSVIIFYAVWAVSAGVIRLCWLMCLTIKAGAKSYWKILKFCW